MNTNNFSKNLTFWDHFDELRSCIFRILAAVLCCAIVAFCFKEVLFYIVLAPKYADFVTYRLIHQITGNVFDFAVDLVNINLAQQFIIHMKVAGCFGLLCVSPYIIIELFRFISPALYCHEKKYAVKAVVVGYMMFVLGVLLNYFLIFPMTVKFLGTYQVDSEVRNIISLESYISTLITLSFTLGILFEIPILSWILAKLGFLTDGVMKKYRRHAIVLILIIAAIITPTADAFTLSLVSVPIYLLYEISIAIVHRTVRNESKN